MLCVYNGQLSDVPNWIFWTSKNGRKATNQLINAFLDVKEYFQTIDDIGY